MYGTILYRTVPYNILCYTENMLRRCDKNDDGLIDAQEFEKYYAQVTEPMPRYCRLDYTTLN